MSSIELIHLSMIMFPCYYNIEVDHFITYNDQFFSSSMRRLFFPTLVRNNMCRHLLSNVYLKLLHSSVSLYSVFRRGIKKRNRRTRVRRRGEIERSRHDYFLSSFSVLHSTIQCSQNHL